MPSSPGISRSVTRTSAGQSSSTAIAAAGDGEARTSAPALTRTSAASSRPSASSSTTRTRRSRSETGFACSGAGSPACSRAAGAGSAGTKILGSVTMNVAPRPSPALAALTVPPCSLDEMPNERQADTESGVPARRAAVGLAESLENARHVLRRDTLTRCR